MTKNPKFLATGLLLSGSITGLFGCGRDDDAKQQATSAISGLSEGHTPSVANVASADNSVESVSNWLGYWEGEGASKPLTPMYMLDRCSLNVNQTSPSSNLSLEFKFYSADPIFGTFSKWPIIKKYEGLVREKADLLFGSQMLDGILHYRPINNGVGFDQISGGRSVTVEGSLPFWENLWWTYSNKYTDCLRTDIYTLARVSYMTQNWGQPFTALQVYSRTQCTTVPAQPQRPWGSNDDPAPQTPKRVTVSFENLYCGAMTKINK